ncbi:MAG: CHAD domain-containing protein [Aphanocapsa sp. GSE-SYN-MK-11-07L]|jgi:CHAD domain-containing protein|nr:CHAD domain-containing protein [Aphanocapsa sp. GSE-SYN-MK-11-07L]
METLADCAHGAIAKHFHKVTKHADDVTTSRDSEAIHQMRVGLRRLRTALQVFTDFVVLPKPISVKQVGAIARPLGEVRDLDVLRDAFKTDYYPDLPVAEQQQLDKAIKKLAKQRSQEMEKAEQILGGDRYQRWLSACHDWLDQPVYQPLANLPIRLVAPDLLLPLVSTFLLHPGWQVGVSWQAGEPTFALSDPQALNSLDQYLQNPALHDLRKQVKRVRYQAELFSDFYGPDYAEQLREFGTLQDLLGHLQDNRVLNTWLVKSLDTELDQDLPSLKQLVEHRQVEQWQTWQTQQQRYLNIANRQSLRQMFAAVTEQEAEPQT